MSGLLRELRDASDHASGSARLVRTGRDPPYPGFGGMSSTTLPSGSARCSVRSPHGRSVGGPRRPRPRVAVARSRRPDRRRRRQPVPEAGAPHPWAPIARSAREDGGGRRGRTSPCGGELGVGVACEPEGRGRSCPARSGSSARGPRRTGWSRRASPGESPAQHAQDHMSRTTQPTSGGEQPGSVGDLTDTHTIWILAVCESCQPVPSARLARARS
jgi:hypothetical protein